MAKQHNFGFNNSNTSIEISGQNINISIGDKTVPLPLHDVWEYATSNLFSEEDSAINRKLPDRVTNKANNPEKYDSSKIIRSLISVGVPLPCACDLALATLTKVHNWIDEHKNPSDSLSTKTIRRFVSQALQELDIKKYSKADIEKWNTKYIRKYGRNNRIVEIYDIPSSIFPKEIVDISYEFIGNVFLPDVLKTTAPTKDYANELSPSAINGMSEDIIEFINNCDLYRISYELLKRMIVEIASQPPHPWIIDEKTREEIISYDKEALKNNMEKAKRYMTQGNTIPYGIIVELLHHASSMVLEHYFSFLGTDDLSSFNQLKQCLGQIIKPEQRESWEFILSDYVLKGITDDFALAGVSLRPYLDNMERIHNVINECKNRTAQFEASVLRFADDSLTVSEHGNYNKVTHFLEQDWNQLDPKERNHNIRTLLRLLFPCEKVREARNSNHFWMLYINCGTPTFPSWKNSVFVIVEGKMGFDYSVLGTLTNARVRCSCDNIFFIAQNRRSVDYVSQINQHLEQYGLANDYSFTILDKKDFACFLGQKDRLTLLDEIIKAETGMF